MSSIRNFEQLILVKELYQDARDMAQNNDRLSLTKAIILLDLSIEQLLKNILLNHNPNYIIPKGRNDINWKEVWNHASSAIHTLKGVQLPEQNESYRLHELRNLVQHNGSEPTASDVRRYVTSTERLLHNAASVAFDIDFDNLRPWDFVENEDLRRLLNESEEFLKDGNPVISVIGCKLARNLIVKAIYNYTKKDLYYYPSFPVFQYEDLARESPVEFTQFMPRFVEYLDDRFKRMETEVILVGLGMPIIDTRRFMQIRGATSEAMYGDGHLQININQEHIERDVESSTAGFMLDYIYRLVRRVEEDYQGVFTEIKMSIPLTKQGIAKYPFKYT